jgi:UDP-GlcNAc:undecaprenyl-phosphate GlcNAc-1-phosphate transferase
MTEALIAFVSSAVFAGLLTPLVRGIAIRFELLDHALSARKIHGRPVPRLGGLAIVGGFFAAVAVLGLDGRSLGAKFEADPQKAMGFLAGALCIALLGVYDDLRGTGAGQKFAAQFLAAGLVYALGFRIEALANPFGPAIELSFLSLPFTLLWIVGVTNAFNLIDGLDGLAGGVALIAVATNFVIALGRGEQAMSVLSAALAGAVLGFLFYNFNPASIFMGDTGSMFLGFVLGTLSLESNQKSSAAVAILIPITALGLPILDTLLAFVRRAAKGRPVFHADRQHIHHRLLAMGLTHRQAVLALYVVSALLGAMAVALSYASSTQTVAILGGLGGVAYLMLSRLGYLGDGAAGSLFQERERSLRQRRDTLASIAQQLRGCESAEEAWEVVKAVSTVVRADAVSLTLTEHKADGETVKSSYSAGSEDPSPELFHARYRILVDGREGGTLEFAWRHAAFLLDGDDREAVRVLCEEIGAALSRNEGRARPSARRIVQMRR